LLQANRGAFTGRTQHKLPQQSQYSFLIQRCYAAACRARAGVFIMAALLVA
jgi:hypothetical protein